MLEDPADIKLDKYGSEDPGGPLSRNRWPLAVVAILGVILVLGLTYLSLRRPQPAAQPDAQKKPANAAPAAQGDPGDQILLPPLDETDTLVRDLVGKLSSHPAVAAWMTTEGLILNFVVVTNNIAKGETPVSELKAVGPIPRFVPRKSKDMLYIDRASYRRYDRHAQAVSGLDARSTARLYTTLKPRIRDAYRRAGGTGDDFDPVLGRAIGDMLRVPVVDGEIALVPHGIVYGFEDEKLQKLSAAQKQLLRMGPDNVRIVQNKLREIASHLKLKTDY